MLVFSILLLSWLVVCGGEVFEDSLQTLALTRFPVSNRDATNSADCRGGRMPGSELGNQAGDKSHDDRVEVSGRESK